MTRAPAAAQFETVADLLNQLGDIPPTRVRVKPTPGTATEKDVETLRRRTDRLYELVDGTLVEKAMGYQEAILAADLIRLLGTFVVEQDLGVVAGADGAVRLMAGLVRIPDVAFVAWECLPARGALPVAPIPDLAPNLAVEVLSESNTPKEMERKLKEYFLAGVRLVWYVDPERRTVQVFTAPDESRTLTEGDTLDGGDVLPGLTLPVREIFARLPKPAKGKRAPRKPKGRR
jgi:Uma2 family endonuclease